MPPPPTASPAAAVPLAVVPRLRAGALIRVTGLFLLSRLVVLMIAALSHGVLLQGFFAVRTRSWVERFGVWDAYWYLSIVRDGYSYNPEGQSSAAFYPLYPLLIRAGTALGLDAKLAGYTVSLGALYIACLLLWRLAARETRSAAVAERTVFFLLICPGAIWFGLIYTESLFLMTTVGCLLCARQGRWLAAGAWGLAAALTRTPGLLLVGFLVLEAAQQWWERRRVRGPEFSATPVRSGVVARSWWRVSRWPWLARAAVGSLGPVAGQAAFLVFLQIRFGDWRAQQKTVAAGWNAVPRWPWDALASQWERLEGIYLDIYLPLLGIIIALAVIGLFTLRRLSYAAFALALATLYVATTNGDATTRYLCTTVPAYLVLAQLSERSRLLEATVLVFSIATMTILTLLRANGYRII